LNLTDVWPSWIGRPIGIVTRVIVALLSLAAGAGAVFLAIFSATFKKQQPEWNLENLSIFALGVLAGLLGLWVALRPSRLSWLCLAVFIPLSAFIFALI
jgi:uncharacterized protein YhhL (DUF1145 family)